jgi:hypothetical protein
MTSVPADASYVVAYERMLDVRSPPTHVPFALNCAP